MIEAGTIFKNPDNPNEGYALLVDVDRDTPNFDWGPKTVCALGTAKKVGRYWSLPGWMVDQVISGGW